MHYNPVSSFEYMHEHDRLFAEHGNRLEFVGKQRMIRTDDPSPWVCFLRSGTLKSSFTLRSGEERVIAYLRPGRVFGQLRSFFELDGGSADYWSVGPVVVDRMLPDEYIGLVALDPELTREFVHLLLREQNYLTERLVYQGESTVLSRALHWLLFMARYYGEDAGDGRTRIGIPMSQEVIRGFLHVSRDSVSSTMKALESRGLIALSRKILTIPDLEAVQEEIRAG